MAACMIMQSSVEDSSSLPGTCPPSLCRGAVTIFVFDLLPLQSTSVFEFSYVIMALIVEIVNLIAGYFIQL